MTASESEHIDVRADLSHAVSLIRAAGRVSFDVFDTLLARPLVRPVDTFVSVMHEARRRGVPLLSSWPVERRAAEMRCYHLTGIGPYVTLEDIYDELVRTEVLTSAERDIVRGCEIDVELTLLRPTRRGRVLYDEARRAKRPITVLSDMYLPEAVLAEALRRGGFEGWDELRVSGVAKEAKYDGRAYASLLERHPGQRIVHVGDDPHADVRQATVMGLDTIHLAPSDDHDTVRFVEAFGDRLDEETLAASTCVGLARQAEERSEMSAPRRLGWRVAGPLLTGFVRYLHLQAKRDEVRRLLFLARDGDIFRKAYQAYWEGQALPNEYVPASRRMYLTPLLTRGVSAEAVNFLTSTSVRLTGEQFIRRTLPDVDDTRVATACALAGVHREQPLGEEEARRRLATAFEFLAEDLRALAEPQRQAVEHMLQALKLAPADAVVDVGWQGTMQRMIERLAGVPVQGYYLGVAATAATAGRSTVHGWVDARLSAEEADALDGVFRCAAVAETLTASPTEESIASLREREDSTFEIVRSGERCNEREAEILQEIQAGALDFVRAHAELTRRLPERSGNLPFQVALTPLVALIESPTEEQARVLGPFEHDNSLGAGLTVNLGCPRHEPAWYTEHPDELAHEREACWWKAGFDVNARRMRLMA